jgi:uncharacterized membrane protein YphA (DoxX/SURF4 family)
MTAQPIHRPAPNLVAPLLRLLIAFVLLVTGTAKLLDLPGFVAVVATYQVLPEPLLAPAAWLVAAGELGLAAWLLSGRLLAAAAAVSALLHAGYMGWAALALSRGLVIPNCGCFGVFWGRPLSILTLFEDAALVALSLLLLTAAPSRR